VDYEGVGYVAAQQFRGCFREGLRGCYIQGNLKMVELGGRVSEKVKEWLAVTCLRKISVLVS
jgi:hypothetical protein